VVAYSRGVNRRLGTAGVNNPPFTSIALQPTDFGVSLRTVQRDLVALRDLGMPIESDRGGGGGIRLQRGWSLGIAHNESEALGMLVSLTMAEKIGSPLLLEVDPAQGRAAFAPPSRRRSPAASAAYAAASWWEGRPQTAFSRTTADRRRVSHMA
jgi:predicted DNA-binding transcriptional regulator YafY